MKSKIFNKSTRKAVSLCLIATVIICLLSPLGAFAASFSGGSGTKKDPYLIKTAEDVNNIRNNLSAHYKLAATIDMSKIGTFEPIGCFDPFTGSLTCDLGADGLPRYAILNLKVYNSVGADFGYAFGSPNYAGYGEEDIHYYASLFGKTQGATLKNILLLNVDITNTVVGQHQAVGGYDTGIQTNVAAQVDDQGTAALVTMASSTTITGCGAQGTINAKTNSTAGLVSRAKDGTSMSNCWADCTITSEGFWYAAGLAGTLDGSSVESSYAKGSIYCPSAKPYSSIGINNSGTCGGGFAARISSDSMVSDCYSEVNFKSGSVVGGTFTTSQSDGVLKNCYAAGIVEGDPIVTAGSSSNNCWVLNTPGAKQVEFSAGGAAEIKNAFSGLEKWDTSGELPKLKNLAYITDYSIFVAGAERAGAGDSGAQSPVQETQTGTDVSDTTSDNVLEGNETEGESEETVGDGKTVITEDFEASTAYIILFVCFAAVTVAISAFSVMMLLKTVKQAKAVKETAEEEVDIDEE